MTATVGLLGSSNPTRVAVSWRCTVLKRLVQSYGSTTWNVEFIFGKNRHTCKAKLDKSLHEEINAEVKVAVGQTDSISRMVLAALISGTHTASANSGLQNNKIIL